MGAGQLFLPKLLRSSKIVCSNGLCVILAAFGSPLKKGRVTVDGVVLAPTGLEMSTVSRGCEHPPYFFCLAARFAGAELPNGAISDKPGV